MGRKSEAGEITVFLALVLTVIVSVLFTVIEAARANAVRFQTECVTDMALQSALAEYNRELLEQYDLFFIDTGYGTEESGYILLEEHIRDYMDRNFRTGTEAFRGDTRDLLQLMTDSVVVRQASGAADREGEVLAYQAAAYMLDRYGGMAAAGISGSQGAAAENVMAGGELLEKRLEEKRQQNEREIDSVDTTVTDKDGKKKHIPVNNPADRVNSRRGSSGIVKLVTDGREISEKEILQAEYLSGREYAERDGFLHGEALSPLQDMLFQKYLMEKCGNYVKRKGGSRLDYQMEYVLFGKAQDAENLKSVVNRLLMLREASNFMFLMADTGKQAEAEALAMTLAAVTLFPELKELIKLSILFAWSYAESVNDVKLLLAGGKVPLYKSPADWKTDLKNAIKLQLENADSSAGRGLTYEDYLHILLALTAPEQRRLRFMDIVEMDIRQTAGNEGFCINHCIDAFTAEIAVNSAKGHSCMITRTVGYQK